LKVYHSLEEFNVTVPTVVTTGTFDGVHIGHRKILDRLNELAKSVGGESVLLTFFPHPRMALYPDDHGLRLLTTQDEKIELLEETGIDILIIHPFTRHFSRTSSTDFVRGILSGQLQTRKLVIGYDHHFGKNREGSFEHLKESGPEYGFDVEEISALDVNEVAVSSTKIRKALDIGDVRTAGTYLGYSYRISGKVITGDKLGRTIGCPTANINVEEDYKLIPANGAYACHIYYKGEQFGGMVNIGHRPTVNGKDLRIEAHLFNFNKEIYGEDLTVEFVEKLRDEQRFNDMEQLRSQLRKDKEDSLILLG